MKAKVNDTELYYELHGKEGAPWLIFSHSLACTVRMWDPQIAAFKDRYRILAYDMRGHGQSAAPTGPYTLEMLADDVLALMKELRIPRARYVGLSIGGMIGQHLALKERRRLVLVPRETPLNLAHLRNMVAVTEMGGIIMPPMPAFYAMPKTLDDLVAHTVGRILDLFGVRSTKVKRWQGLKGSPAVPD